MMVLDPFNGEAPSVATDGPSIIAAAQTRLCLLIDNISTAVGPDIENLLCKSAYGSAVIFRKLYANGDSVTLALSIAWHLTGITAFLRQADTLDRAIVMQISKPADLRSEIEVRQQFATQHPYILGGLLFFLAERMRAAPNIVKQQRITHRMVDFAVTGESIAQSLGMRAGEFIAAQDAARATGARDYIEGDGFAAPLVAWLQDMHAGALPVTSLPPKSTWLTVLPWVGVYKGRTVIIATAQSVCDGVRAKRAFDGPETPRTARATTGAIQRVRGLLTRAGWEVEASKYNSGSNTAWAFKAPR